MSDRKDLSTSSKIPKLHNNKGYELWCIYIMGLIRKNRILCTITEHAQEDTTTTVASDQFNKMNEKTKAVFVFVMENEHANSFTLIVMSGVTTGYVWKKLQDLYQKIQFKLNSRTKIHKVKRRKKKDIQKYMKS